MTRFIVLPLGGILFTSAFSSLSHAAESGSHAAESGPQEPVAEETSVDESATDSANSTDGASTSDQKVSERDSVRREALADAQRRLASVEEPEKLAPNAIYAELGGPGGFYSLNYEHIFSDKLAARIGISYFAMGVATSAGSATASTFTVPLTLSYVGLREGKHGLEVGGGGAVIFASSGASVGGTTSSSSGVGALLTGFVGYRLHPVDK